jgi:hypothetical protein
MGTKKLPGKVIRKPVRGRGRVSVTLIGCYELPDEQWPYLFEAYVAGPRYAVPPLSELRFYSLPEWDEPPEPIIAQFVLDEAGENLAGSYLHPDETTWESLWSSDPRRMRQHVTIRFASFVPNIFAGGLLTPAGVLELPDSEPIPERLLRLIWVES